MAKRSPTQHHNYWGVFPSAADLPNVTGSGTQSDYLEVGDVAYVEGGGIYQCDDATDDAAVWTSMGGTDRYSPRIIVGNSVEGDTLLNCHYLDTGNGVQLEAALAAAVSGVTDVYIRPGRYDLGAGAVVAPLSIPTGVRVRGAGRDQVTIVTRASGDQGAFVVTPGSSLEDLRVEVATPTAACSGSTAVVLLLGTCACRTVDIEFESYWTLSEAQDAVLRAAFQGGDGGYVPVTDALFSDCRVGFDLWAPSLQYIGLDPGEEFASFLIATSPTYGTAALLDRCLSNGADAAFVSYATAYVTNSDVYDAYLYGVYFSVSGGTGYYSSISHNRIRMDGEYASARGITLSSVDCVDVTDNLVVNRASVTGTTAIELLSTTNATVNGNRGDTYMDGAIYLDASSNNNVVIGNNFQGSTYTDLGTGNDLAHNK